MPLINLPHQGVTLYYERHGAPSLPTCVLLAGLKADHTIWSAILPALTPFYNVIILDNRGTGRTTDHGAPFTVTNMAEDVVALLDALQIERAHLIGHSLGGAIAQTLATTHPDKVEKLVLCNTFMKLNQVATLAFEVILDCHKANFSVGQISKAILPWGFSHHFLAQPHIVQTIIAASEAMPVSQTLAGYQAQYNALIAFDSAPFLNQIVCPTLVIASEEDIIIPLAEVKALAKQIQSAELCILPGGHASQIEQPALLSSVILSFLD